MALIRRLQIWNKNNTRHTGQRYWTGKMAIDNSFMKKRLEKMEYLFALFSAATHLPFVECDENTFDDEIYVFATEEMMQTFAKSYAVKKYPLQAMKLPKKMFAGFFSSLYQYGVTAVMFQDEGAPVRVPLSDLAEPTKMEGEMAEKLPVSNPELQLTAMYFVQEMRKPVKERDAEEKQQLRELEEEMAHNFFKATFIVAFDTSQIPGQWDPKDKSAKIGLPLIKAKDGRAFLPVFSDVVEFRKFAAKSKEKRKMRLVPTPFENLIRFVPKEGEGIAINPAGVDLAMTRAQLERLNKLYNSGETGDKA